MNDRVHVILACDRAFRMQVSVSLSSLCDSFNFTRRTLHIHLFHKGLTSRDKERIARSAGDTPTVHHWHDIDPSPLRNARTHGHVSLASYFRILAFDCLSASLKRVIYLDSDTVVRADLNELWDLPLQPGTLLAAAQDPGVPFFDATAALGEDHPCLDLLSSRVALWDHARLGISKTAPYFNAGVLVVNLAAWRESRMTPALLGFIQKEWQQLTMWDQDALNALLWNRWQPLPPKWNVMPSLLKFRPDACPLEWPAVLEATTRPAIIHFADRFKPWHHGYSGPFKKEWFDRLDKTAWKGWRPSSASLLLQGLTKSWRYVRDGIQWHSRRLREKYF